MTGAMYPVMICKIADLAVSEEESFNESWP